MTWLEPFLRVVVIAAPNAARARALAIVEARPARRFRRDIAVPMGPVIFLFANAVPLPRVPRYAVEIAGLAITWFGVGLAVWRSYRKPRALTDRRTNDKQT